jgi:hypothetical protein
MALVAEVDECLEAAQRIVEFTRKLAPPDLLSRPSSQFLSLLLILIYLI